MFCNMRDGPDCFRLPVKACRPQSQLCVPRSYQLRFKDFVEYHGQGRVNSVLFGLPKNCCFQLHHLCHYFAPRDSNLKKNFCEYFTTLCGARYGQPGEEYSVLSNQYSVSLCMKAARFLNSQVWELKTSFK